MNVTIKTVTITDKEINENSTLSKECYMKIPSLNSFMVFLAIGWILKIVL